MIKEDFCLGPNSGSSADYTYGRLGIKYSYGVELRDTGEHGFLLPPSLILPTAQENFAAFLKICQGVVDEFSKNK